MNTALQLDEHSIAYETRDGGFIATCTRRGHSASGKTEAEARANLYVVAKMLTSDADDGVQD